MFKLKKRVDVACLFCFTLSAAMAISASAQTPFFTPGNLVVTVEGNGVVGGSGTYGDNQAAPFTLFQYAPTGSSSAAYVNSLVFPQLASGANQPVSGEYGSSSEGSIQLDGTGRYLTVMGYGINPTVFNSNSNSYSATANAALAQSGSLTGQSYTPISRVVALIDAYGNVNSSTALYNVFSTNNPRSAYTLDGSSTVYVSGQGNASDSTGGVFLAPLGATTTAPTAITGLDTSSNTLSQDTRAVQIYNNTLYVSLDSREGSGNNRSFVGTLGTPPSTSLFNNNAGPTQLTTANNASTPVAVTSTGKLVLTASEANGINSTGQTINLSPENFFFASPSVLYVADSGSPKQTSASSLLGDGGLQKWVNTSANGTGTWKLQYTMYQGLNLVANAASTPANTTGATGLVGLTGIVSGSTVYLYATNYNIADLDTTYLYGITDTLSATTNPGNSFTKLATAPADSNFKGVSLVPTLPAGSATITSSPSGVSFTSAGTGCKPGTYTTPVTLLWTAGSACTLTVASPSAAPGTTYTFSKWQDGTTGTTDAVSAPTTSAVYTATFTSTSKPFGNLEVAVDATTASTTVNQADSLYISGWVADAVDGTLSNVKVYVDGTSIGTPTLGGTRQDVAVAYDNPAYSSSGYSLSYAARTLTAGSHSVTVVATDAAGNATTFGPLSITVTGGPPVGNLEEAVDSSTASTSIPQSDSIFVSGWTADPSDGSPLGNVKVYVDGNAVGTPTLGISRPDVASYYHDSAYTNSGFQLTYPAASLSVGSHSITVVSTDSGGRTTTFGPLTINVTTAVASAPFGNLEEALDSTTGSSTVSRSDSLFVSGWVADAVDGAPLSNVNVYIDGSQIGAPTLGIARPDVASYYHNSAYTNSGYQLSYPASTLTVGTHSVSVIAIDSGGRSTSFGPLKITVQ